jgi:acetyl esterase
VSTYELDAEVAAFVRRSESFAPPAGAVASPADMRAGYDRLCAAFHAPYPPGLLATDGVLEASGPARTLPWRRYTPEAAMPDCTVLYLHGGGFVVGGLGSHDSICAELAAGAGTTLLALDYRLAPEQRYPAALDDAEAAFDALAASGQRVVVGGDSAGGSLAAALCLRLRRLGKPLPIGQLLIYPGLHPHAGRAVGTWRENLPMLRAAESVGYRRLYTGRSDSDYTRDPELAPLAAADFSGLPRAAIFAAEIDPLAEDSSDYAAALQAAGVTATLHPGEGLVHGYLRGRHSSVRIAAAFAEIVARLRELTGC